MTLVQENGDDIAKSLVTDGLVTVEKRKEKRLQKLMEEYYRAQDGARKARVGSYCYNRNIKIMNFLVKFEERCFL